MTILALRSDGNPPARVSTGIADLDYQIEGGFPKGSLILLAGNPGSGKTIFAGSFLHEGIARFNEKGIYASFAEGHDAFCSNMERFGFDFRKIGNAGSFSFLDLLTVKGEGMPEVTEAIVSEVFSLGASRLVIDSFSAIAQAFPQAIEARSVLHTVLGKVIRQAGCTTLLISEVPIGTSRLGLGIEEFVADGVLRFSQKNMEGRTLRLLEVHKLRGTRIGKRQHVFTLDQGFKLLKPFEPHLLLDGGTFEPTTSQGPCYSTGIRDLDAILGGGFRRGSHNLLEVSEDVSIEALIGFLTPVISNSIGHGDHVMCIPVDGMFPEELQGSLRSHIGNGGLANMQIFDFTGRNSPNTLSSSSATILQAFDTFWKSWRKLRKNPGSHVLGILGFGTLEAKYAKELQTLQALADETIAKVRSGGDVMLSIARPFSNTLRQLASASDTHLKLTQLDDMLCLSGVKPRTDHYGARLCKTNDHLRLELKQIL